MSSPRVRRRLAERALAGSGVAGLSRFLRRDQTMVLAYHNIVATRDTAGADAPLHLTRADFADQMASLRRTHEIVPLEVVLSTRTSSGRPRAAITFDDAYVGAVFHGVDVLAAMGLPGTIFVTPGRLGGDSFWWDALSGPISAMSAFRAHVLRDLSGRDAAARAEASKHGLVEVDVPSESRTATEGDLVSAMQRHSTLTFGAHTWTHPNLATLRGAELSEELERPRAWLESSALRGRVIDWVAYPYGGTSPHVEAAARAAGYRAGLSTESAWLRADHGNSFAIPRVSVPGTVSIAGFTLRTAGLRR